MDEVAVVEGLEAQVAEELVPLGAEGPGEPVQVEAEEVRADPPDPDPVLDGVLEERRVPGPHLIEGQGLPPHLQTQRLVVDDVEEQAGGHPGVVGLADDECPGSVHLGPALLPGGEAGQPRAGRGLGQRLQGDMFNPGHGPRQLRGRRRSTSVDGRHEESLPLVWLAARGKARRKSGNGRPVAGKQANPRARRQRPAGPRTPRTPLLPYPRRRKVNLATGEGNRQVFGLAGSGASRRAPNLLAVASQASAAQCP